MTQAFSAVSLLLMLLGAWLILSGCFAKCRRSIEENAVAAVVVVCAALLLQILADVMSKRDTKPNAPSRVMWSKQ